MKTIFMVTTALFAALAGAFMFAYFTAPGATTSTVPEKCADAFYQLGAAHLVSTEMLLDNNLPGALIAVQSGSEALELWEENCI